MPAHKRRLSAALLKHEDSTDKPTSAGRGGAWRAGLHADTQHDLSELRAKQAQDIMQGRQTIMLKPNQIVDLVGTDRRSDWQDQTEYHELRDSIEKHGQDVPIEVCPTDPDWQPSATDPADIEGVQFELITGRRRRSVAQDLGLDVRAVVLPRDQEGTLHHWQVMLRRYRENNHRSNLSPFERMLSVGEMFDAWTKTREHGSIRQFAGVIGIDATFVSRSNRLCKHEEKLRDEYPDPYKLGYREIEAWITRSANGQPQAKSMIKPTSRGGAKIEIDGRLIEWKRRKNSLVLTIPDVDEDPSAEILKRLLEDLVQELTSDGSKHSS